MSRTSLKQQLMREQMVQQERKEALARQQQLQKLQSNSRLTPQHLNIGSSVINNNGNLNTNKNDICNNNSTSSVIAIAGTGVGGGGGGGGGGRSIGPMKVSEAASCPNFFTDGFNTNSSNSPHLSSNLAPGNSSTTSLITSNSTTTATSSNTKVSTPGSHQHHHHSHHVSHHSSFLGGGGGGNPNGSGTQSPFPLSPDSPHSGPRSSASEMDEYWEDVHRTLVMEMPDLIDQNGGGKNDATMGSEHVVSNSINVIHHPSHHSSHHSQMDQIASTLPADIGYPFNPHQIYGGEDSIQSTSQLSDVTKMSSSCPPLSTSCPPLSSDPAEYSAWERERKKKDAHNKIERRRRYNINDRIKELSTLLPTQDETYYDLVKDMKQNKGTILKASVDFVKELKRDVSRIPELEQKNRELELQNRKMSMRLQQLEQDLRTTSMSEEPHGLYKPDSSAPRSIQFGQQAHHHAHHIHNSTHHGTPTPPPNPQSIPHLSQSFHHTTSETDYWLNGGITLDNTNNTNSLQSHPQHITSSSLGHHHHHHHHHHHNTDVNSDLVDSIYGSSRMSTTHHHPIIKQEYNVSPSQSSSGLGSLSSPTSLSSSFLPLSQMLINDTSKDSLGITSSHVKGELPSPQVMDVCD